MTQAKTLVLPGDRQQPELDNGSIFFVGTATVILRYAGFTILTDPNFLHQGDHIHVGYGVHATRQTNPAIEIEQLPPLDLVILSHLHDDHFDHIAAEKLDKDLPIVTTAHAAKGLQKRGFKATRALQTWETLTVSKGDAKLRITSMPGIHGPGLLKFLLPPVMGSMLEFQASDDQTLFRLYISGDTLIHKQLRQIPQRFPEIDLALLHLGGTQVLGVLLTMNGQQGVEAIQIIRPQTAIPIHFNDYTIFKSPLSDFMQAVAEAGLEEQVRYLSHGETYRFQVAANSRAM